MQIQDIRAIVRIRIAYVAGIVSLLGIAAVLVAVMLADSSLTTSSDLRQMTEVQESIHASFDVQSLGSGAIVSPEDWPGDVTSVHGPFDVQLGAWISAFPSNPTVGVSPAHATFEMQFAAWKSNAVDHAPAHATFDMQMLQR